MAPSYPSVFQGVRGSLHGLERDARDRVVNLDAPARPQEFTGSELLKDGLTVTIPTAPGAALFTYSRVR